MQFFRTFLVAFKFKPVLSSLIFGILCGQILIEGSSLFSLVPLVDMLVQPDEPTAVTREISSVIDSFGIKPSLSAFLFLVGFMTVFRFFGLYSVNIAIWKFQRSMDYRMTTDLYATLFSSRWAYFASNKTGVLAELIKGKCHHASLAFLYIFDFWKNLFLLFVFCLVPLLISFKITVGCIVVGGLLLSPLLLAGRLYHKIAHKKELILNEYTHYLFENLSAAKLIFAYAWNGSSIRKFRSIAEQYRRKVFQGDILANALSLLSEPVSILFVLLAIYLLVSQTDEAISSFAVIIYSLKKMMSSGHGCVAAYTTFENHRPAINMVMDESKKASLARELSGGLEFSTLKEGIEFVDVGFCYAPGNDVLEKISLTIKRGKITALVGGSGGGKTTAVDLITGLFSPDAGEILVDGVNLSEYSLISWRRRLGYIPQESALFNTTIRENILWGAEGIISDDEIVEAARRANAHEFILECEHGYNTVVGDRGLRLSGGQRQRISLARALVRKPAILILDEATSALDSESESIVQKSIEELTNEVTIVVVAHRLSTVCSADIIYILDRGRIAGSGSFADLEASNAVFQRYSELQRIS